MYPTPLWKNALGTLIALVVVTCPGGASVAKPFPGVRWTEHLVWNDFSYGFGLQALDVNGDGALDITVADTSAFVHLEPYENEPVTNEPPVQGNNLPAVSKGPRIRNSHMYWFRNDGKAGFTRQFIARDDLGRRLEQHVAADLNRDGRQDIVIVDNHQGDIVWFEHPGPEAVARGESWKKRWVSKGNMLGAVYVTVADFDGDGWLDVAGAGWRLGNCFRWFRNPGSGPVREEWEGTTIDGGFPLASCVATGDIDGDQRPDLVVTSGTSRAVLWYKPSAEPLTQPWRRQVVDLTPGPREPAHAKLVDLNRDGRLDIVLAMRGSGNIPGAAVWYENAGIAEGRVQWRKRMIGEMRSVNDVDVGDIDGDGAVDVAACSSISGEVAWFRNSGNPAARWTRQMIKENWPSANHVIIADLDGDGRMDLASVADYGSMELRWWRNEGPAP